MTALENGPIVHFGATGYQDFTEHGDEKRKASYLARHEARETWTLQGIKSAGFWARWILWNKRSLTASIADVNKRFGSLHVQKT